MLQNDNYYMDFLSYKIILKYGVIDIAWDIYRDMCPFTDNAIGGVFTLYFASNMRDLNTFLLSNC